MREDIEFKSKGDICRGWFYHPTGNLKETWPAIVMAHGFSAVKEMDVPKFAEVFAAAGFAVLLFDYRFYGASEGEPQGQLHPVEQLEDYRSALTYLSLRPEVDSSRLGVWGTSFSGGHVLHLGAFDRRVKCVVSQVPAVDIWENFNRLMTPTQFATMHEMIAQTREKDFTSGHASVLPVVSNDGSPCLLPSPGAYERLTGLAATVAPSWRNVATLDSFEKISEYRPALSIELISPRPLLMIVAVEDLLTPADLALQAYSRALEPKSLLLLDASHYEVYDDPFIFNKASQAACDWFKTYLIR
ncbi:MAG: alpha/beta hydrolase [Betaproteobacteria bacterium]|nr:alpha/beta hydrolase [Betaproteobacteria bacterium]